MMISILLCWRRDKTDDSIPALPIASLFGVIVLVFNLEWLDGAHIQTEIIVEEAMVEGREFKVPIPG